MLQSYSKALPLREDFVEVKTSDLKGKITRKLTATRSLRRGCGWKTVTKKMMRGDWSSKALQQSEAESLRELVPPREEAVVCSFCDKKTWTRRLWEACFLVARRLLE